MKSKIYSVVALGCWLGVSACQKIGGSNDATEAEVSEPASTCASADTIAGIKSASIQGVPGLDVASTGVSLNAPILKDFNSTTSETTCAATVVFTYPKALMDEWATLNQQFCELKSYQCLKEDGDYFRADIAYTIQPTADGKQMVYQVDYGNRKAPPASFMQQLQDFRGGLSQAKADHTPERHTMVFQANSFDGPSGNYQMNYCDYSTSMGSASVKKFTADLDVTVDGSGPYVLSIDNGNSVPFSQSPHYITHLITPVGGQCPTAAALNLAISAGNYKVTECKSGTEEFDVCAKNVRLETTS